MNDKKIAFIIAVNNEQYFEECCFYIHRLSVPAGPSSTHPVHLFFDAWLPA